MKQEKQDRRSQRSRNLVCSAMMELLLEKRYDEIIVQDILDRANIGRSTFYTHYFDKEDVLASIAEQQLALLSQQFARRDANQEIIPSLELFQHAYQNQQYFRAMLRGHTREILWDAAQASLSRSIEQALALTFTRERSLSVPLTVIAQYLAGAFLNLLQWWLEAEMPYPPEQMAEMFRQLALPGVRATMNMSS